MNKIKSTQEALNERLGSDLKMPIVRNFEPISGLPLLLQDIQQLLLTIPGERVMRPEYGCSLRTLLWENIDDAAIKGAASIRSAIVNYEPRVKLINVVYNINRNTDLITFGIKFMVINTNVTANLIFPFRVGTDLSFS